MVLMFTAPWSGPRLAFAAAVSALAGWPCAAAPLERVTYLLPAPIYLPAFGPWIVARQRGYYAAEGLEINFETARGGADVAKQIGVGIRRQGHFLRLFCQRHDLGLIGRCHIQHCIDVFVLTIDLPVADLNAGSKLSPPSSRLTGREHLDV